MSILILSVSASLNFSTQWILSTDHIANRSLNRDIKYAVEKEQAIKLIRTMVEIGTTRRDSSISSGVAVVPISDVVLRSVIAVAEHLDDPFRPICIETLTEICKSHLA